MVIDAGRLRALLERFTAEVLHLKRLARWLAVDGRTSAPDLGG